MWDPQCRLKGVKLKYMIEDQHSVWSFDQGFLNYGFMYRQNPSQKETTLLSNFVADAQIVLTEGLNTLTLFLF